MKIGIWKPQRDETSVRIYTENVTRHLRDFGHELIYFGKQDAVPDAGLIWDPSCTGAQYPNRKLLRSELPWIVTLHGAANLSQPLSYTYKSVFDQFKGFFLNQRRKLMWSIYKHKVAGIITVSAFAKEELVEELGIRPSGITVIYHGYNDDLFFRQSGPKDYLFHVSVYQPKKNVERLIEAYQSIPSDKLPLLLVCPGFPYELNDKKIKLIRTAIDSKQVAAYMKGAYAFIFPSLHESFGMPLLEAMACGVPLITSNTTACPEICGDAGLLCDPLSAESIREAIIRLLQDNALHAQLSQKARERAKDFSWQKTARLHEALFKKIISENSVN